MLLGFSIIALFILLYLQTALVSPQVFFLIDFSMFLCEILLVRRLATKWKCFQDPQIPGRSIMLWKAESVPSHLVIHSGLHDTINRNGL